MPVDALYGRNAVHETLRAGRRRVHTLFVAERTHGADALVNLARREKVPITPIGRQHLDRIANTSKNRPHSRRTYSTV